MTIESICVKSYFVRQLKTISILANRVDEMHNLLPLHVQFQSHRCRISQIKNYIRSNSCAYIARPGSSIVTNPFTDRHNVSTFGFMTKTDASNIIGSKLNDDVAYCYSSVQNIPKLKQALIITRGLPRLYGETETRKKIANSS